MGCFKSKNVNEMSTFDQTSKLSKLALQNLCVIFVGTFSKIQFTAEDLIVERRDPLEMHYQLMDPPLGKGCQSLSFSRS